MCSFTSADPKSANITVKPSVFFTPLGSERVKALSKMLVKSILGYGGLDLGLIQFLILLQLPQRLFISLRCSKSVTHTL